MSKTNARIIAGGEIASSIDKRNEGAIMGGIYSGDYPRQGTRISCFLPEGLKRFNLSLSGF